MSTKYAIHNPDEHEAGDHGFFPNWEIQQDLTDPDIQKLLVDSPEQLMNAAVRILTDEEVEDSYPVRLGIDGDEHRITGFLTVADALGPDGHPAQLLHGLMLVGRDSATRYVHLSNLLPEADSPSWDEEHAVRALTEAYGDEYGWWGLGSDQVPNECVAVLARHLIGRYDYWTWADYSRATMTYRLTVRRLHPDDPEVQLLDSLDGFTREDWAATVDADVMALVLQDGGEAALAEHVGAYLVEHDSGPLSESIRGSVGSGRLVSSIRDAIAQNGITLRSRDWADLSHTTDLSPASAGEPGDSEDTRAPSTTLSDDSRRLEAAITAIGELRRFLGEVTDERDMAIRDWLDWESGEGADLLRIATGSKEGRDV